MYSSSNNFIIQATLKILMMIHLPVVSAGVGNPLRMTLSPGTFSWLRLLNVKKLTTPLTNPNPKVFLYVWVVVQPEEMCGCGCGGRTLPLSAVRSSHLYFTDTHTRTRRQTERETDRQTSAQLVHQFTWSTTVHFMRQPGRATLLPLKKLPDTKITGEDPYCRRLSTQMKCISSAFFVLTHFPFFNAI